MLNRQEQIQLARDIKNKLSSLGDYLYMEKDKYINRTIEALEKSLGVLIESFYDENTYIELVDTDNGSHRRKHFEKGDVGALCHYASRLYAFDDIDDTYRIYKIVCDGHELEYVGWQAGMLFEFVDLTTGEIVYSAEFPNWDH